MLGLACKGGEVAAFTGMLGHFSFFKLECPSIMVKGVKKKRRLRAGWRRDGEREMKIKWLRKLLQGWDDCVVALI